MTSSILITGGTGTVGRHVVPLLKDAGHQMRVLSRRSHRPDDGVEYVTGDLLKDEGIEPAVDQVEIVLHLSGGPKGDDVATRNLGQAASRAGVRHLVCISVIGAERIPMAWLRSKVEAERAVADSGVPWTVLRTAQFHDFVLHLAQQVAKLPVVPILAGIRWQPVDTRDVAARLVALTLGKPAGRVPDLVGPKLYETAELMRGYLAACGKRRLMVPVPMPGKVGRAHREGGHLTLAGADVGTRTWEDFLSERLRPDR